MISAFSFSERLSFERSVGSWYVIFEGVAVSREVQNICSRRRADVFMGLHLVLLTTAAPSTASLRAPR